MSNNSHCSREGFVVVYQARPFLFACSHLPLWRAQERPSELMETESSQLLMDHETWSDSSVLPCWTSWPLTYLIDHATLAIVYCAHAMKCNFQLCAIIVFFIALQLSQAPCGKPQGSHLPGDPPNSIRFAPACLNVHLCEVASCRLESFALQDFSISVNHLAAPSHWWCGSKSWPQILEISLWSVQ